MKLTGSDFESLCQNHFPYVFYSLPNFIHYLISHPTHQFLDMQRLVWHASNYLYMCKHSIDPECVMVELSQSVWPAPYSSFLESPHICLSCKLSCHITADWFPTETSNRDPHSTNGCDCHLIIRRDFAAVFSRCSVSLWSFRCLICDFVSFLDFISSLCWKQYNTLLMDWPNGIGIPI